MASILLPFSWAQAQHSTNGLTSYVTSTCF